MKSGLGWGQRGIVGVLGGEEGGETEAWMKTKIKNIKMENENYSTH